MVICQNLTAVYSKSLMKMNGWVRKQVTTTSNLDNCKDKNIKKLTEVMRAYLGLE
jgi:hypothetical protein